MFIIIIIYFILLCYFFFIILFVVLFCSLLLPVFLVCLCSCLCSVLYIHCFFLYSIYIYSHPPAYLLNYLRIIVKTHWHSYIIIPPFLVHFPILLFLPPFLYYYSFPILHSWWKVYSKAYTTVRGCHHSNPLIYRGSYMPLTPRFKWFMRRRLCSANYHCSCISENAN